MQPVVLRKQRLITGGTAIWKEVDLRSRERCRGRLARPVRGGWLADPRQELSNFGMPSARVYYLSPLEVSPFCWPVCGAAPTGKEEAERITVVSEDPLLEQVNAAAEERDFRQNPPTAYRH
jgi:hypothetical protein